MMTKQASAEVWDAAIIGAGPAGAVAATLLARRGWRVILLEKSPWPRDKVCGGCVNAAALGMLNAIGLGEVVDGAAGVALDRFVLRIGPRQMDVNLPRGMAIERHLFDARLVQKAQDAGVTFVDRTAAVIVPDRAGAAWREISCSGAAGSSTLRARVVLACDGLRGSALRDEPWAAWRVANDAWFGVAALIDATRLPTDARTIGMHLERGRSDGYVGTVRLDGARVHVAAALDPAACQTAGGPAALVGRIIGMPLDDVRFTATGLLTRRRTALGGHRVLAVGDACGYVEPFTGEGIAWAIRGAIEAVRVLPRDAQTWTADVVRAWTATHRQTIAARQRWCRALRFVIRHPRLASAGIRMANGVPSIGNAIASRIGQFNQHEQFEPFNPRVALS